MSKVYINWTISMILNKDDSKWLKPSEGKLAQLNRKKTKSAV